MNAISPAGLIGVQPDAALLAACDKFVRLEEQYHRLTLEEDRCPDGSPQSRRLLEERDAVQDAEEPLLAVICGTPALTLVGMQAKAKCLCAWDEDAIKPAAVYPHDQLRTSLLHDLLAGEAA